MVAGQSQLLALPAELRTMIASAPCQKRFGKTTAPQGKVKQKSVKYHDSREPSRNATASIDVTTAPTQEIEQEFYRLANHTALRYAETHHWSSFHPWNAVNQAKSTARPISADNFWDNLKPYGSCLGASTHIYHDLISGISTHLNPSINKHANTVKLMTCAQHATSETGYHAIVALCFDTHALVIDHSIHPTAFKIPLGGEFITHSYIPLSSDVGLERFKFFVKDSKYLLTMDSAITDYPALSFTPMNVSLTVSQLAIPAASQTKQLKGTTDVWLPPRKYVSVRTLLDQMPEHIPSAPLHGKFLATALRLQISFEDAALLMQIPRADWLEREQGKEWAGRVSHFDGYVVKCEATVHVSVKLESARSRALPNEHEQIQVSMLGELGEEFGLGGKVVREIAEAIFRAWAPYRGVEEVGQE
jgi:hypothetical protein